jgi:hypothetical protein
METKDILITLQKKYGKNPFNEDGSVKQEFLFFVVNWYEKASQDVVRQLKEVKKSSELSENL